MLHCSMMYHIPELQHNEQAGGGGAPRTAVLIPCASYVNEGFFVVNLPILFPVVKILHLIDLLKQASS
jgi:hypothetical protein